ncbi:MAG: 50S ribosomal protein L13 [Nitrospirae bacterium]|nr:50S ribosomal protein L13 [Nitrospirota bacterium]
MSTVSAKKETVERKWLLVDATDLVLGRLSAQVAAILRGKHKPIYTPHVDTGDFVVIVNADKVRLTGNKLQEKVYYHHSNYPGGLKSITAGKLMQEKPEDVIKFAVKGMLPKGPLGRDMILKLKVYAGSAHPHEAQRPEVLTIKA